MTTSPCQPADVLEHRTIGGAVDPSVCRGPAVLRAHHVALLTHALAAAHA